MHFNVQIDQQIAADENVELGEGGIGDNVLGGERDHFTDFLLDPVPVFVLDEITVQPLGGNITGNVGEKEPQPGLVYGVPVEIGVKDLQGVMDLGFDLLQDFPEDDGQGIGLFAGGAPGRPCPQYPPSGWLASKSGIPRFSGFPTRQDPSKNWSRQ